MKKVWSNSGENYFPGSNKNTSALLDSGIYIVNYDPRQGFFLTKVEDEFSFPYKVYGLESKFINRVLKTHANTSTNTGILMSGIKGSGKTVTGKILANRIGYPVIVINKNYESDLINFLMNIEQEVTLFFDEYEKVFEKSSSLLTLLDGALSTQYRKFVILTTNSTYIEDSFIQRPGRIRYLKKYSDLEKDVIVEMVDDMLINKEHRDSLINVLNKVEITTVDVVKTLIQEVNIHDQDPEELIKDMNFEFKAPQKVHVYYINNEGKRIRIMSFTGEMFNYINGSIENLEKGDGFSSSYDNAIGRIVDIIGEDYYVELNPKRPLLKVEELDKSLDLETKMGSYYTQKEEEIITIKLQFEKEERKSYKLAF